MCLDRKLLKVIIIALIGMVVALMPSPSQAAQAPVPPELIDAIKHLKKSTAAERQKTYDLLSDKGDARLIPALKAYKDGLLQLKNDRLAIYGDRISVAGRGQVLPLIDAVTGEAIHDAVGAPIYSERIDLTDAIKAPPRSERAGLADLISTLSLLDPDPAARLQSIRDAGNRVSRAFIDVVVQARVNDILKSCRATLAGAGAANFPDQAARNNCIAAIDAALGQKRTTLLGAVPDAASASVVSAALTKLQNSLTAHTGAVPVDPAVLAGINNATNACADLSDRFDSQKKELDEIPRFSKALHRQLEADPNGPFSKALIEATSEMDAVTGTHEQQLAALDRLGHIGTNRADNLLKKFNDAAALLGDPQLSEVSQTALGKADRYQTELRFIQNTFAGLSLGSILVLLALGLSIIFGLMGVINMAQGEFMMVGAFTTYVVSSIFSAHFPAHYDYYPIVAVPAAFLVSALVGLICEVVIIRHLYGRPLETLLATYGIGLILIQVARVNFSDNLSVKPPSWMEGGIELVPDLTLPLNRLYIIFYCAICIAVVYFVVNRTKLGLLLRATTQNRQMASALGVATRRIDAVTFAIGAGLAGLAGVAVPLYNKINPSIGQEYIVDCFMVVVAGGVGKLAGAIIAGIGLGFINKYSEWLLSTFPSIESGASVYAKVFVLVLIVMFLQWRPAGLFPPKGRVADA